MRVPGPAHPDTLTSRMGTTRSQVAAGDLEAATALFSAAVQDAESLPPRTRTGPPSLSAAIGLTLLEGLLPCPLAPLSPRDQTNRGKQHVEPIHLSDERSRHRP